MTWRAHLGADCQARLKSRKRAPTIESPTGGSSGLTSREEPALSNVGLCPGAIVVLWVLSALEGLVGR